MSSFDVCSWRLLLFNAFTAIQMKFIDMASTRLNAGASVISIAANLPL
ncbi:hypothetical protein NT01EI_2395 [Edwardsiella ictaluri 93-146]|uniref:Uncharacterized protein n=1 Tax=Edwardsiella ictaluri (strain 93-146) TaxID=634503 RepID=C5BA85_EDWI9|nr:hypothetical protein [Edwardsiella ictaluri]ACR69565.1 hypothetical protein NT01EI_2395 [Edwardsiella ictaluri 93-146]